jgi:YVTN family beta-propeller protein
MLRRLWLLAFLRILNIRLLGVEFALVSCGGANVKSLFIALTAALVTVTPAFAAAAELLVLNKSDSTLSFIDPVSGNTTATIPTGDGPHEVELSIDERLAFVSNYGANVAGKTLSVIDVAARKELKRVDLGELRRPHGLSFSNGKLYFTVEDSRRIGRYDPKTQRVDWTFETDQGRTHMVIASRDGSTLFASNMGSNTIGIIERGAADQWKQTLISVGAGPEGLDLSPDGRELWSAHSGDGGVSIIDVAGKKVIDTFDAKTKRSNRVKFTPDGRLILISDLSGGELVVFDARKRSEKARIKLGKSPSGILIPNNEQAYVAVSGDNHVAVVDLKTLSIATTIKTGNGPDGMAWRR